jgi:cysteine desulfurase
MDKRQDMSSYVYLDHNATTTTRPEAIQAVTSVLASVGNPSSVHKPGRDARKIMEQARAAVADLVNGLAEDVVFTSGGTEANNLALKGCGRLRRLVSAVEHSSVLNGGGEIIEVDKNGIVDLERLDGQLLSDDTPALISVMLANNETGVIEPIKDIVAVAHRHGALVHCDAIQAAGKISVDIVDLGVDVMTLSAHKIGGAAGSGAVIVPGLGSGTGCDLKGLLFGGGQEHGYRVGTENLAGIAGFGAAASAALSGLSDFAELANLRDAIDKAIKTIEPNAMVLGVDVERLPNTTCLTMPGTDSDTQVMAFDLAGFGVSAGSACSSGKAKASDVLKAMKVSDENARSVIRVSLGWPSEETDVDAFIVAWRDLYWRTSARKINLSAA